jgi:hypothetical protein
MDRDEAIKLLTGGQEGIAEWNQRRESGEGIPELSEVNLSGASLSGVDLSEAFLRGADLSEANLSEANLWHRHAIPLEGQDSRSITTWLRRARESDSVAAFDSELDGADPILLLFPIRLDDAVMETPTGWASHIRQTRHIGDFWAWENHEAYQSAFARLLRDLRASEASE